MLKQKKTRHYKPIQSTQQNIPIRDFVDGIIITKDDNYIKVIEVLPIPYFLKKISDQNHIGDIFFSILKSAPDNLHFKSVSVPADLSKQLGSVKKHIADESNLACKRMGEEYKETLLVGQRYGISRRFFVSFPYKGKTTGLNKSKLSDITKALNLDAERLIFGLNSCGNETVRINLNSPNESAASLFYMLYHRSSFLDLPFETHIENKYREYFDVYKSDDFYMPPTDYIAPNKMSFVNSKYLVIDDTYYSFLYIPSYGYNPDVICGWLDNFINSFPGVDVDIFLKKIPKTDVQKSIIRSIGHSKVSLSETTDTTDSFESASNKLSSGYYLKNGLASGQDFYYLATIITVSGLSPEDVDYKKEELKKIARQMDITLRENKFECEKTFNAVLPTGMFDDSLMEKMKRNILTDGAASLYPFTTFQMIDEGGIYIADDANGSPVIIDLFNRKRFTNPHIFICGETGSGKTVTLMMLALRARINKMPVFIIAPEKENEFRRICEGIGGEFISIGSGSKSRLNIMEIFKRADISEENESLIDGISSFENSSLLEEKISILLEFLNLHIKDLTIEEMQLLNEALISVYKEKGITTDNESLWKDKTKTSYKAMPIIDDLAFELSKKEETRRLSRAVKLLTTGSGAHFNGQTNINTNTDFMVIGLEHNTKEMLGLSVYAAMDFCWSQIKQDRTKKKFFFIDEWWVLAFNKIAAERSLELSKVARAYSCSLVFATQQMSDILAIEDGKYGEKVLNNCATKILMSMKEKDAYSVKNMVNLSDSECEMLSRQKPGQGLLIAGDNRVPLNIKVSETEGLLAFTDSDSVKKYADLKRQELMNKPQNHDANRLLSLSEWQKNIEDLK